ncbi:DNA polymerase III subunit epsilon [Bacillus pseudomycoides]|uniref:DNA polymerase III subunit epsilon n=1 Tax=Bacillus pseudomycoides TaxID=64104 RepID=A0AAJ1Z430_9BACI|nr:type I restriction endonuclease [Bacillus pseudomycoides]MBD5799698.1 DNA polymerase III subunit epsilon [Bacillus pseudomycoides]MCR8860940.1 type I restriction endonuclease [Bacillus pseudomycoides]MDR4328865.1 DNA polymerase III subunit epsilon [Bacillus pseudomycoides]MED1478058.1 type I restriction endonuclease [Bacillus pseudomycoides]MED1538831.1 type I restriction endonuclease [Bacillus pseudomycoides]
MEFRNDINKIANQILERKEYITNEEMTKQSLIIPFLQKLGYDVFNPLEVRPEYIADFGAKKGEKVDYAVFKNGVPIILIEAKSVTENLLKHDAQLSRYFNALPDVKVGVLTNGVEYKFYTDLTNDNVMDEQPFFTFNMDNLSNVDIETIETFTKENFEAEGIVKYAEELIYMTNLNSIIKELFKNPSDDFLRFLIKDFSSTRITNNVLDRFRPIVKKAINQTLLEIISDGLTPKEPTVTETIEKSVAEVASSTEIVEEIIKENKNDRIITTDDELIAFDIVKEILVKNQRDISDVKYKDTISYFGIMNRVITKWFIRLFLESESKSLVVRLDLETTKQLCPNFVVEQAPKSQGVSRIFINDVHDLKKLEALILSCYDQIVTSA